LNGAGLAETVSPVMQYVWGLFVLVALPLVVAAVWKQVYPYRSMLLVMALPLLVSLGLLWRSDVYLLVLLLNGGVCAAAAADAFTIPRRSAFRIERSLTRVASLKFPHEVTLLVANLTDRSLTLRIRDDRPQEFVASPQQLLVTIAARSRATLVYHVTARRRGAFQLESVHLQVTSRWRFWQRLLSYPLMSEVHVYPDMKQLSEYAILARTNRLSLMGVRRTRRIGQDHEFERLRDYTRDDNYKHMDWRATARRRRLTVKDYQSSQSQRLMFLLDCGRMMTNESMGLSLLDHAMNAALMLAYVALRQGDQVGVICFSDQVHSFVPPRSGLRQMNHLLHACFDRFPRLVESRYDQAFLYLATHCRKRSLVVLVTNLIDEVNALQVKQYLGNVVGRHLPLAVLLRDRQLFSAADAVQPEGAELYRAAAAAQILCWRQQVLNDLLHQGALVLDAYPDELTAPLVNRYLEVKARHLL
jgi:uncharacterized protein (DUF58 family)